MKDSSRSPTASVIVPCRKQPDDLQRCVEALRRQQTDVPFEILVVFSADDTQVAQVVAGAADVRAVVSPTPLFAGDARNLGVEHAQGECLAFTDSDCVPDPRWLDTAVRAVAANGSLVVGGPVTDALPRHPVSAADNLLQFVDFPSRRPDGPASYLASCNLALHRDSFLKSGGYPPGVKVGEDVQLCDAMAKHVAGGVRFVRAMRVQHKGRCQLSAFWRHQHEFGYYRGLLGLRLRPRYQEWGKSTIFAAALAVSRLQYFLKSTIRWNKPGLIRLVILSPLILLGLTAWGLGFRNGCRKRAEQAA